MIDPRPSAVDMPHSSSPPWRSQPLATQLSQSNGTDTLSALSGMRMPANKVRRIPETRPVAVRRALFPGPWGSNRCLQHVALGKGLESPLGLYPEHLHPGPGYIIRPSGDQDLLGPPWERGCPLGSQNSTGPVNTPDLDARQPSVTATPKLQTPNIQASDVK